VTGQLALAGCIALVFGLGAYRATDHFGAFSAINVWLGAGALAVALAYGAVRRIRWGSPDSRRLLLRGGGITALALTVAVGLERAADRADLRFDWTFEERFEPALATRRALAELCGPVEILLFYDPRDPRIRRTRLLVETLAGYGDVSLRELELGAAPEEVDRFGVGSSNSLVIRLRDAAGSGDRYRLAERPSEGAIYEALYGLCAARGGEILALRGEGEGDLERGDDVGYAGLAAALATEGYAVRSQVTTSLEAVPEDVDAVLVIAPRRHLHRSGLAALERFLGRGGRLIALLEPGSDSGLEAVLARWGIEGSPSLLHDPVDGAQGPERDGAAIVAYHYDRHPIAAQLDRNRMTYFSGARAFSLRKPEALDELSGVVLSSPEAWLSADPVRLGRRGGAAPNPGVRRDYFAIAVAGRYVRDGRETRIFAVGDADFASNRHLRTLYNLDLVMNGVHWALAREPEITLRPKIRDTVQFPLPVTDSLRSLYGVGLLLPELLLIAGGAVWIRRRAA